MLVADGRDTSVWFDQWLPTVPPRRIENITGPEDSKVSDQDTRTSINY